jgi:hypothetical protein
MTRQPGNVVKNCFTVRHRSRALLADSIRAGYPKTLVLALAIVAGLANPGHAQFRNVRITSTNAPEETTVVIDPNNPLRMAAGANKSAFYYSTNGGIDWAVESLSSSFGEGGDPCVLVDTNGSFYFFHLSGPTNPSSIVCQKLDTLGSSWSDGASFGLNGKKIQDKSYAAMDRASNRIYVAWTQFDSLKNYPTNLSLILFSASSDGGQTFSPPARINEVPGDCSDSSNALQGAVPVVGPNGEVYVTWAGATGIVLNKSLDGGNTWLPHDIPVADQPGGWDITVPGLLRCNGLPVPACDLSAGPYRGTLYVNWCDQRNGTNDTDVWLVKSVDGGLNWTPPRRVNDDLPGKHQFLPWFTVDQTDGTLYSLFYDRRNYSDDRTDVYLAVSRDGGDTFVNALVSKSPFTPLVSNFFGDYIGIAAEHGLVRPVWTRADGGSLSVWTAIINPPPQIAKLVLSNSVVDLTITNLTSYLTNSIERSFDLSSPSAWAAAATFTGVDGATNWSESVPGAWTNAFYRIRSY